jgi:two-component system chemotaxis response regulator CheY
MKKKILIADDSASMRQLVSFTLMDAGYSVISANNGRDALSIAETAEVDMVVTDLNMPELDGIGLVRGLRQMPGFRYTPVVMLTTESQKDMKQQGKDAGASGWITKPFTPDSLLRTIRKFLR